MNTAESLELLQADYLREPPCSCAESVYLRALLQWATNTAWTHTEDNDYYCPDCEAENEAYKYDDEA